MPGKQCFGQPDKQPKIRESRSFCEGLKAATDGELVTVNPHPAGTDDAAAWDKGWNAYNGGLGSTVPTCCAHLAYTG